MKESFIVAVWSTFLPTIFNPTPMSESMITNLLYTNSEAFGFPSTPISQLNAISFYAVLQAIYPNNRCPILADPTELDP